MLILIENSFRQACLFISITYGAELPFVPLTIPVNVLSTYISYYFLPLISGQFLVFYSIWNILYWMALFSKASEDFLTFKMIFYGNSEIFLYVEFPVYKLHI
jgi:hypothetical protein